MAKAIICDICGKIVPVGKVKYYDVTAKRVPPPLNPQFPTKHRLLLCAECAKKGLGIGSGDGLPKWPA